MSKKKSFLAAVIISCISATAFAETIGDTIVIEKADKVKIETRDTVQRIVITGSKDDPQFHYTQRISISDTSDVRRTIKSVKDFNKISIPGKGGKPSKWESSGHFNIGLNAALDAPEEYKFKVWPSFELGLTWLADYRPFGKKNVWSVGMGVYWRHYRSSKDYYWWKVNDVLKQVKYPEKLEHTSTSLNVISLGIPIMYTHYFDNKHKWGLTLGAIVNWNSAYARRYYEVDDEDYDVSTKKIGQRPITIDGIAIVRIPSCPDIYCKYCPMEFFKDGRGPKMHQLSFGFYW